MTLHELLDFHFGTDGPDRMRDLIAAGTDLNATAGEFSETPLHVAARRRRKDAVARLLDAGAEIDARTAGGKTAYAHCVRRGFDEIAKLLAERGAETSLNTADRFAVAVVSGDLDEARSIHAEFFDVAYTENPEEDRLLADMAGRQGTEAVQLLIEAGANLEAPGLDGGTPLHQAAWFGQPENAELLIDAGAPLEIFDPVHTSSPLGWAVHGSRYSGGAQQRQDVYVALTRMLLAAGSQMTYPHDPEGTAYRDRLMEDASADVQSVLASARPR